MKIFISWSGERSKALAQALRDWLPLVLHYVEPWMSDVDIAAGERWEQSIAKELNESNFGIICVTSGNMNSPWILFEAGALCKFFESSRVIPLLLDLELRDISGPLSQFQAKKLTKSGIEKIIQSIQSVAEKPLPTERAEKVFNFAWPELSEKISKLPVTKQPKIQKRTQEEILEELVASVRSLDARIQSTENKSHLVLSVSGNTDDTPSRLPHNLLSEIRVRGKEGISDLHDFAMLIEAFSNVSSKITKLGMRAIEAIDEKEPEASNILLRLKEEIFQFLMGWRHFQFDDEEIMRLDYMLGRFNKQVRHSRKVPVGFTNEDDAGAGDDDSAN